MTWLEHEFNVWSCLRDYIVVFIQGVFGVGLESTNVERMKRPKDGDMSDSFLMFEEGISFTYLILSYH